MSLDFENELFFKDEYGKFEWTESGKKEMISYQIVEISK